MGIADGVLQSTVNRWNTMCKYSNNIYHHKGNDNY